jgi:hypothetical protein
MQFIDGEVDIPAEEGKSSVVSHDLADTLHWIMPSLLRVFLSSDQVAVFEPTKPGDEENAKQATDYINFVFLNDCKGYRVLYGALYDGLLSGNGIIKHWWDPTPVYAVESFTGLSDDQYDYLIQQPEIEEVLEHSQYPDPSFTFASAQPHPALVAAALASPQGPGAVQSPAAPADGGPGDPDPADGDGVDGEPDDAADAGPAGGEPAPANLSLGAGVSGQLMQPAVPMLHDCKVKRCKETGRIQVKVLPPEEFLIERNATQLDEDHVRFCGHRYLDTRSNLIKAGYDRARVEAIPTSNTLGNSQEKLSREDFHLATTPDAADQAVEQVEVFETYLLVDYDGDGVAEWRKVVMGGQAGARSVLANDEWGEDLPFTDLVPEPVPHRWRGRSLFDETADIQRIKSVLMRQTLDNLYQSNNPMQEVVEGAVLNLDALINRELGANVFVKSPGAIRTIDVPFTAQQSFGMLEYLDKIRGARTGVSEQSMGLGADALQNQSATSANLQATAAYTKQEAYARNVAEVGLKRLFRAILKLMVKHQDRPRVIRLRGTFVEMSPSAWDADMDVAVNVGLGSGSRDKDMAMLAGIKQSQEMILAQMGPTGPLVDLSNYRNTLAKMVEISGAKNVDQFFNEIPPQVLQQMKQQASQPKPDPKMLELQAKTQADAQKMQMQAQIEQAKAQALIQMEQQRMQMEFAMKQKQSELDRLHEAAVLEKQQQIEQMQAQADVAVKQQEAQFKAVLAQQKFEFDKQLEYLKLMGSIHTSKLSVQPGGIGPQALASSMGQNGETLTPDSVMQAMEPQPSATDEAIQRIAELVAQANAQQNARIDDLQRIIAAPTEIVRHPDTGKVIGSRKVPLN